MKSRANLKIIACFTLFSLSVTASSTQRGTASEATFKAVAAAKAFLAALDDRQRANVRLDGQRQRLALVNSQFPSFQDMSSGLGTIRIEARATWAGAPGRHSLFYQNNYRPDLGVYLVNALLPANRAIEITEQHRDPLQRGIRLDFNVKGKSK